MRRSPTRPRTAHTQRRRPKARRTTGNRARAAGALMRKWAVARLAPGTNLTRYEKTRRISALREELMDTPVTFQRRISPEPAAERLRERALALYDLPFNELLFEAHTTHRANFAPNAVQRSTLLSIKTGGCPEDCGYCPQAARYHTDVKAQELLPLDQVVAAASAAKAHGATRFCMGAAWRGPKARDLAPVLEMVRAVKALGLETCCTLGMLKEGQAEALREAGLDYYNHNLDTAPEHYGAVITTRDYADRLDTLERVRGAGLKVCCGGIVGMGESREHRAGLI